MVGVHSKLLKLVLVCLTCLVLVTGLGLVLWRFSH